MIGKRLSNSSPLTHILPQGFAHLLLIPFEFTNQLMTLKIIDRRHRKFYRDFLRHYGNFHWICLAHLDPSLVLDLFRNNMSIYHLSTEPAG